MGSASCPRLPAIFLDSTRGFTLPLIPALGAPSAAGLEVSSRPLQHRGEEALAAGTGLVLTGKFEAVL